MTADHFRTIAYLTPELYDQKKFQLYNWKEGSSVIQSSEIHFRFQFRLKFS